MKDASTISELAPIAMQKIDTAVSEFTQSNESEKLHQLHSLVRVINEVVNSVGKIIGPQQRFTRLLDKANPYYSSELAGEYEITEEDKSFVEKIVHAREIVGTHLRDLFSDEISPAQFQQEQTVHVQVHKFWQATYSGKELSDEEKSHLCECDRCFGRYLEAFSIVVSSPET